MVKSVKDAMEIAFDNSRKLDDEALLTFVIEAEALVNSRPLTYLPLESDESEAITPNHFLLGTSDGVRRPAVGGGDNVTALQHSLNQIQRHLETFWQRWVREYLPTLTKRTKWFGETKPVAEGDLVMIIDGKKRDWIRGRIKEVIISGDGRIRQALVQTARGFLRRPVSKLAVLDIKKYGKTESSGQSYGGEDVGSDNTVRRTNTCEAPGVVIPCAHS